MMFDPVRLRGRRGLLGDRSGQALVEMALVTPILLLLLLGVVELSRAERSPGLDPHCQGGAPFSCRGRSELLTRANVRRHRESLALAALDPSLVEISFQGWKTGTGNPARIELRYPYEFMLLAPFFELSTGKRSVMLSTAFVMRNE